MIPAGHVARNCRFDWIQNVGRKLKGSLPFPLNLTRRALTFSHDRRGRNFFYSPPGIGTG